MYSVKHQSMNAQDKFMNDKQIENKKLLIY